MFHRIVMSLCVLSVVFFVVGPAAASTLVSEPYSGSQWYVTPLGVPGSASMSVATGINSNGQVVGYYGNGVSTSTALDEINNNRTADGSAGTFLWSAGTPNALPTTINVSGTNVAINESAGFGISTNGTIVGNVGYTDPTTQVPTGVAAVYSGGQWQSLGIAGSANAISANGQTIVGGGYSGSTPYAFTYSAGTLTNLGGSGAAFAMSSNGAYLAGGDPSYNLNGTGSGGYSPWAYNGAFHDPDSSYLETNGSGAMGCINSSGVSGGVIGSSGIEVFRWNSIGSTSFTNMANTIPSYSQYAGSGNYDDAPGCYGITDSGDIVGAMSYGRHFGISNYYEGYLGGTAANGQYVPWFAPGSGDQSGQNAFLYSASGNGAGLNANTSYDLNNLIPQSDGWVLEGAMAVAVVGNVPDALGQNHTGEEWIVGYGTYQGEVQAFLLTPTLYTPVTVTPEPSTLLLLSSGLAGLLAYAWKKRR